MLLKPKLWISVFLCLGVGIIGGLFTTAAIPTWYAGLNKPIFSPPNWVFGPVWTLLYILMGVALFLVWEKGKKKRITRAVQLFAVQLFFNFIWSLIFFAWHQPLIAFVDILALWIAIWLTRQEFSKISQPAAKLLLPYLAWVSFAALLNFAIVFLN